MVCNIFMQLPSIFFSIRLVSVHVVHPYCCIDTTADFEKRVHRIGLTSI